MNRVVSSPERDKRVIGARSAGPCEAHMSYDLGVLNLAGGRKKSKTKLYVAVGVVVLVVVVVLVWFVAYR